MQLLLPSVVLFYAVVYCLQHHEEPALPYLYPRVHSHRSSAFAIEWPENDMVLDVGKLCDRRSIN